ncbi:MAG: c-type cytochrome [Gemmatimonadales bacterium]
MRRASTVLALLALSAACRGEHQDYRDAPAIYGFGRAASPAEIRAWDIDVRPDGTGLPRGSGTAKQGAPIYASKCASCHGATGKEGPFDQLVGREPRDFSFGRDINLVQTIGNYWPYATTIYDYINRAMPQDAPGSLTPEEVYALTAFLLWKNEIVAETTLIDAHSLPRVVMPAHDRFVPDNRRGGKEIR